MHKIILALFMLVITAGCANWNTPSTYRNFSSPAGNVVEARGRAADYAAGAHRSYHCISCTGNVPAAAAGSGYAYPATAVEASQESFLGDLVSDFQQNLRWAIDYKTRQWLYE